MNVQMMTAAERSALEYLRAALPEADWISLSEEYLMKIVRHALAVREETPWGKKIPEWIFRAFVLFPRVNNEDPVFYHESIWRELRPRLQGKGMEQAVQEVNLWCCERATYQSTDNRTANALTVLKCAFGRCGEESTLLVSALRAAGIPARQMYTPRWAHCDDNHAWVEAWVDGEWRYLGACEPEPALDSGWFTAASSRAMLIHTRAYGVEPEGERTEGREGNAYVINRTAAYARTRLITVRVTQRGVPKRGAVVRFEVVNMAELYPINEQITDENGEVALLTGLGTLHLHIHDGARHLCRTIDVRREDALELDFGEAVEFESASDSFDQCPPEETSMQPCGFPTEIVEAHTRRLAECDSLRTARIAAFDASDPHLLRARGNHAEIRAFLEDDRFEEADKRALLSTLRDKDFIDATAEMLADALAGALPFKDRYPGEIWCESVLAPRVANEMLYPAREYLRKNLPAGLCAHELWEHLCGRLKPGESALIPDLRAALRAGVAGAQTRNVLFIAAARALGIAARLNPATGEKEIWQKGGYVSLLPMRRADAVLTLREETGRELQYGLHFTVGVLEGGVYRTLRLYGSTLKASLEIPVFPGRYRVITCTRQIDGSVSGATYYAEVGPGGRTELSIALREDCTAQKLIRAPLPPLRAGEGVLPRPGRSLIALIAPGQEPTEHFLNELLEAKDELDGLRVELIVESPAQTENAKLHCVLEGISAARLHVGFDAETLIEWRRLMRAGELRLPLAIATDREGRGLFAFINYNVGSVKSLLNVLDAAR